MDMTLSAFLAKLIGLYCIIFAAIWLVRRKAVSHSFRDLFSSKSSYVLSATFSLLFGLIIAIDHSIWELSWRGLITIIGYLAIVKGVLRLAFPSQMQKVEFLLTKVGYWPMLIIIAAIGIFLTYQGFYGQ